MVKTLFEKLSDQGLEPSNKRVERSKMQLHEKGAVYVLSFQPETDSCAFQIDGNVIKDKTIDKCDYVVLACHDDSWAEIFVELKGSDIAHAIAQIKATINHPTFKQSKHSLRRARVVTPNRIPSNTGNSVVERAKVDFKKAGCDFRAIKSLQPDVLRQVDF